MLVVLLNSTDLIMIEFINLMQGKLIIFDAFWVKAYKKFLLKWKHKVVVCVQHKHFPRLEIASQNSLFKASNVHNSTINLNIFISNIWTLPDVFGRKND